MQHHTTNKSRHHKFPKEIHCHNSSCKLKSLPTQLKIWANPCAAWDWDILKGSCQVLLLFVSVHSYSHQPHFHLNWTESIVGDGEIFPSHTSETRLQSSDCPAFFSLALRVQSQEKRNSNTSDTLEAYYYNEHEQSLDTWSGLSQRPG